MYMMVRYTLPGFPGGSVAKNPPANAEDSAAILGSGRSPGEGNDNPRQYSCLENPMGRGAWGSTEELQSMGSQELDTTEVT